jgi:uncharacterized protein GlcG (DUF336 family)
MTNVIKKHSISFDLAQKMVNEAVAKERELGVTENVAILDDGGNLQAFSVSTQDFFNFIQGDPSLLAGIPTLARMAAWGGGFPREVNGEVIGVIVVSGAPTVQNASAALALVSDAVPVG